MTEILKPKNTPVYPQKVLSYWYKVRRNTYISTFYYGLLFGENIHLPSIGKYHKIRKIAMEIGN